MDFLIDELCHHGIKGQKWGVRRFQNPDGSLTLAGKKRYNKSSFEESGWTLYDERDGYHSKMHRNFERRGIPTFFTTDGVFNDAQKRVVLQKEAKYVQNKEKIQSLIYDDVLKNLRSSDFGKEYLSDFSDDALKETMYLTHIRIDPDKDYSDQIFVDLSSLLGEGGEYVSLFSLKTNNVARPKIYSDNFDIVT